MSPPSKRPNLSKGAAIAPVLLKALSVLKDPKVQQQIFEHRQPVVDAVKRLRPSIGSRVEKVGDRFGQRGLERRAANLQQVVTELSSESPALATNLAPVIASLNEARRMLRVSATLPFTKRKRAHWEIDDVLDDLESGILDATHPDVPPEQQT